MQYELINMSDPYTFIAENKEIAALVVFSLSTMYGAESENKDDSENIPVFIFGGAKDWYKEQFHRTPDEGLESNIENVANALESFMLGSFKDRKRYQAALNAITDEEKKEQFIKEWQDDRSSLNNIGERAHQLAKHLKQRNQSK